MRIEKIKAGAYYIARSERFGERLVLVTKMRQSGTAVAARIWVPSQAEWTTRAQTVQSCDVLRDARPADFSRFYARPHADAPEWPV